LPVSRVAMNQYPLVFILSVGVYDSRQNSQLNFT
jgi:hypothetical protein